MDAYDEDLTENVWYQTLSKKHEDLFQRATNERWMICIPQIGSWKSFIEDSDLFSQKCFESHIMKPVMVYGSNESDSSSHSDNNYVTYNGKELVIHGSKILCTKGFSYNYNKPSYEKCSENLSLNVEACHTSTILFEETFFNQNDESYPVLCISEPLEPHIVLSKNSTEADQIAEQTNGSLESYGSYLWQRAHNPKRLRQQIDERISQFVLNPQPVKEHYSPEAVEREVKSLVESVLVFLNVCQQVVLRDNKLKKLSEIPTEKQALKSAIEEFVMHGIGRSVIARLNDVHAVQDRRFNKVTRNLASLTPSDLSIKDSFSLSLPRAGRELTRLNRCRTVTEKLRSLHNAVLHLSSKPKQVYSDESPVTTPVGEKHFGENAVAMKACGNETTALSTDDLLPILIYLVVKCDVNNWFSTLCYLKHFHFAGLRRDEAGFYIATLEAALEHVKNGNVEVNRLGPMRRLDPGSELDLFSRALRSGDVDTTRRLIRQAETVRSLQEHNKCHPLCECAECQSLAIRNTAEASRGEIVVGSRDEKGRTPLHIAAITGKHEMVEMLIGLQADLNSSDYHGATPLHHACQEGNQSAIFLLLHYGADPNAEDNNKNTPLHLACLGGHDSCVKALLFYDPVSTVVKVNAANDVGDTPLHIASKWGYVAIVTCLMEYGADPHQTNRRNVTPFNVSHSTTIGYALRNTEVTNPYMAPEPEKRFEKSAKKSVIGKRQQRRTMTSVRSPALSEQEIAIKQVEKLLRAVADNDIHMVSYVCGWDSAPKQGSESCHPLCQCCKCQPPSKDIYLHANSSNSDGVTPLISAAKLGYDDLVALLLRHDAKTNARTKVKGHTPLHLAAQYGHEKIVGALLDAKAECDARDADGNTPIYMCAMNGHSSCADLLLQMGASVNLRNQRGDSPLHEAVRWKHSATSRLLIEHGALGYYKNNKGQTVLDLAEKDYELYNFLLKSLKSHDIWTNDDVQSAQSLSANQETPRKSISQSEADELLAEDLFNHLSIAKVPATPPMVDLPLDGDGDAEGPGFDTFLPARFSPSDPTSPTSLSPSGAAEGVTDVANRCSLSRADELTERLVDAPDVTSELTQIETDSILPTTSSSIENRVFTFTPPTIEQTEKKLVSDPSPCKSLSPNDIHTRGGETDPESSYFEITPKKSELTSNPSDDRSGVVEDLSTELVGVQLARDHLLKQDTDYLSFGKQNES